MPYIIITAARKVPGEGHKACAGTGSLVEVWPQADGSGSIGDRCHCVTDVLVSRRAVATLGEAREGAELIIMDRVYSARDALGHVLPALDFSESLLTARELPESGGSVGPLPDGTLIQVGVMENCPRCGGLIMSTIDGEMWSCDTCMTNSHNINDPFYGILWPWTPNGDDSLPWVERDDDAEMYDTDADAAQKVAQIVGSRVFWAVMESDLDGTEDDVRVRMRPFVIPPATGNKCGINAPEAAGIDDWHTLCDIAIDLVKKGL